jgi:hypothetical protein
VRPDEPLDDWFYSALAHKPKLTKQCLSQVARWQWFKGPWCPLDPRPFGLLPGGIAAAKPVKKQPAASRAARKGHFEAGLDEAGQLVLLRQYVGNPDPYLSLYFYMPGRIRLIRFGDAFTSPVQLAAEYTIDAGKVTDLRSYGNPFAFPRPLTAKAIAAHKKAPTAMRLHERCIWNGEVLTRIEVETVDGSWALQSAFEYAAGGKLKSIWRPYGHRRQQTWPKQRFL